MSLYKFPLAIEKIVEQCENIVSGGMGGNCVRHRKGTATDVPSMPKPETIVVCIGFRGRLHQASNSKTVLVATHSTEPY